MNIRNSLIWGASVIGAGAVMALIFGALEKSSVPETISVVGECQTSAIKDRTAITLRIKALDANAAESMRIATEQTKEITNFLVDQDVEMQTTEFNSYEKTEWNRDTQKSVTLGIETTIALEISADNINEIERVLNKFAGTPNVYSENLRMYSSNQTLQSALERCLAGAVENARVRADALATGDKQKSGKMLAVSYDTTTSANYAPVARFGAAKLMATESSIDTSGTLVTKDTDVSVRVTAVFEIK